MLKKLCKKFSIRIVILKKKFLLYGKAGNLELIVRQLFFLSVTFAFSICALRFFSETPIKIFHIFFFNLVSGGLVILYMSENKRITFALITYILSSVLFILFIWYKLFYIAFIFPLIMAVVTEKIRYRLFSFFPLGFFMKDINVMAKFHHAALLCLSITHILMSVTLLNNHYFSWWYLLKLNIDIFYLAYSFPVSLTIISYIMAYIYSEKNASLNNIKNLVFWILNLGVIILFFGILLENVTIEIFISLVLTLGVAGLFYIFWVYFPFGSSKIILISGLFFLFVTAISGIFYAVLDAYPQYSYIKKYLLKLHAIFSLFGWNLNGLIVVLKTRYEPSNNRYNPVITFVALHWISLIVTIAGLHSFWITFSGIALFIMTLFYGIFILRDFSTEASSSSFD